MRPHMCRLLEFLSLYQSLCAVQYYYKHFILSTVILCELVRFTMLYGCNVSSHGFGKEFFEISQLLHYKLIKSEETEKLPLHKRPPFLSFPYRQTSGRGKRLPLLNENMRVHCSPFRVLTSADKIYVQPTRKH